MKYTFNLGIRQPNGWYPDHGNQCRLYYLCTEQRKTKMGECPIGSKWNPHRLRCDDPRYIAAPCKFFVFSFFGFVFSNFILGGYRSNDSVSLSGNPISIKQILIFFSILKVIIMIIIII
jgi:hypothetical protein